MHTLYKYIALCTSFGTSEPHCIWGSTIAEHGLRDWVETSKISFGTLCNASKNRNEYMMIHFPTQRNFRLRQFPNT